MMPGHGAVVLELALNALVCLVQVAELAAGDFLQAHFLGGAPHPDMEGAATLQRPGGVLLPAVLPGWTLGRAGARWWADRGPHPCRRRSAFRPRRCRPTCCPAAAGTGAGALHWQPGGPTLELIRYASLLSAELYPDVPSPIRLVMPAS